MPAPASDPQREAVYDLQAEFAGAWGVDRGSRAALETYLAKAARYYRVDPPKLVISRRHYRHAGEYVTAEWDRGNEAIILYPKGHGDNIQCLLHEFSHYVVDQYYDDAEDHGPEFCAVYMHLLDKYCIFPASCFRLLARKYRVKIGRRFRPSALK